MVKSLCNSSAEGRGTECSLALGGIVVWLLNGLHRRPQDHFQSLAEEVCQRIPVNYEDYDPEFDHDDAEATEPLMYSAGVYFVCDVVPDTGSPAYRIPYHKQASEDALMRAFKMSHQEIARITGMNQIREVPRRRTNAQRTNNRSTRPTLRADYFRPEDRALPQINNALDDVEIRATHRMRGEDVTHFMNHGGGNRAEAGEQEMGQENVTVLVQKILEQFFIDMITESPNRKSASEGPWTNIPKVLRHQEANEALFQSFALPFAAVQFAWCSPDQWMAHFDKLFPERRPQQLGQNFGKCSYFLDWLRLMASLDHASKMRVHTVVRVKFNELSWVPFTKCDRMWCTSRAAGTQWGYLPGGNGRQGAGPQIALNSKAVRRGNSRPTLRPAPVLEGAEEEEEEEEEERN